MQKTNPTISDLIRKTRIDLQLTQVQLAELANVEQSNLSKWERGEKSPWLETVQRLATAMKVDYKSLLPD